jgi:hypothetical protein
MIFKTSSRRDLNGSMPCHDDALVDEAKRMQATAASRTARGRTEIRFWVVIVVMKN